MLDQYENCLFSELCLCEVDLRVDIRIHTGFPQYCTGTSLWNGFLFLSYPTSTDKGVFWNFEINDEISDRGAYMVNDNIPYKYLLKVSQWNYNGEKVCCVSQKHCAFKIKKNVFSIYLRLINKWS